ncbi:protein of unknown function (plasmid) [Azospirillum baldaniorum]|uniref:Transposase n=1 Tax=Azospirillum baldaniorum TaxID=1064539 RepID=A0A9P1NQD2_9PROT|nr:protein of unknown function [Azospirillum baldaniorum]
MRIQAYLAAAAVNLKRLAAVLRLILDCARQRSTGLQQKAA